jgi:hypothetical protein
MGSPGPSHIFCHMSGVYSQINIQITSPSALLALTMLFTCVNSNHIIFGTDKQKDRTIKLYKKMHQKGQKYRRNEGMKPLSCIMCWLVARD